jgi:DNA polymerase (family 10)/putative hydrolase
MRAWQRYEGLRLSGEWHVHTAMTDGSASVEQLCDAAERLSIPLMAFTEHVRRSLDYDFGTLLDDIDKAKRRPGLTVLSGLEAKVLPDGSLDVEDNILESVDYPIFAFHSFPADKGKFMDALRAVLSSGRAHAWAHPGTFTDRSGIGIEQDELDEIMGLMARHRVALEINARYMTPGPRWIKAAARRGVAMVRGSDIHSLADLEAREERWSRMRFDP